jgi:hypothetical protein
MHAQSIHRKPLLIGTWAPAIWAIEFYERNGFTVVSFADKEHLLRTYWDVPERQIATSIVLADRQWMEERPGAAQCSAGCPS